MNTVIRLVGTRCTLPPNAMDIVTTALKTHLSMGEVEFVVTKHNRLLPRCDIEIKMTIDGNYFSKIYKRYKARWTIGRVIDDLRQCHNLHNQLWILQG